MAFAVEAEALAFALAPDFGRDAACAFCFEGVRVFEAAAAVRAVFAGAVFERVLWALAFDPVRGLAPELLPALAAPLPGAARPPPERALRLESRWEARLEAAGAAAPERARVDFEVVPDALLPPAAVLREVAAELAARVFSAAPPRAFDAGPVVLLRPFPPAAFVE